MENSSLVAPMKKPFHDVSMPKIPPTIIITEKISPLNMYEATSAIGITPEPLISTGAASETPVISKIYHIMLTMMHTSIILPIYLGSMFISSEDCGMTSKPISIAGTIRNTYEKPSYDPNISPILSTLPNTAPPKNMKRTIIIIAAVAITWNNTAGLTPKKFRRVMITAPSIPTSAHDMCT